MASVAIQKTKFSPAWAETEFEAIRKRAFELFARRGPGDVLADWLDAEREFFEIPPAEMADTKEQYTMDISLPGFEAKDIVVNAMPDYIVITARTDEKAEKEEKGVKYSRAGARSIFRSFDMMMPCDVDRVKANFEKSALHIIAPKAGVTRDKSIAATAIA